jgi:HlyD family secretion protein
MSSRSSAVTAPLGRLRRGSPGLGPRQIIALLVVLAVTTAGGYYAFTRLWGSGEQEAPAYAVSAVTRQTITSFANASGTVAASKQVKLSPVAAARLEKLNVKQGDAVQAGQELARLDATTLEIRRDTATSQLAAAQSRLQALLAGPTAADVAAQQQAVSSAQSTLTRAQNDLQNLLNGITAEDVAAAQANLDRARAALDTAQQNYDKLVRGEDLTLRPEFATLNQARSNYQQALTAFTNRTVPNTADVATAQQQVQSAQAGLDAARAKLIALTNPNASDVSTAQSQVRSAQAGYDAAQARHLALINPPPGDVAAAQAQLDSARSQLDAARARYAAVFIGGTHADRVAAQAAVDAAQASLDSALARRQAALGATPSNASDLAAADAAVAQAQVTLLNAQNALSRLLGETVGPNIAAAEQAVHSAETAVTTAQTNLNRLLTPQPADLAASQQAIQSAQAQLSTAQTNLARLLSPQPADLLAAQQGLESAQTALTSAQTNLDKLLYPNQQDVAQAQAALDSARAALDTAQTNWDRVVNLPDLATRPETTALNAARADYTNAVASWTLKTQGPKPGDVQALQAQIDAARASLSASQTRLSQLLAGPLQTDIDQQQEAINQLTLSLKSAQADLDAAVIRAPFAGTIVSTGANEGDQVGAATALVTLLDPALVQITATLDEASVAKVKAGQAVVITFDALTGRTFRGQVASVTPAGVTQQGVVTFPVSIVFDPQGTVIPAGLTATLRILTDSKTNVTSVPARALKRQGREVSVDVILPDGTIESRPVQVGLTGDSGTVEVTSGLNEGEQIAIPNQQRSGTTQGAGGAFGAGGVPGLGGGAPAPARPVGR